MTDAARPTNAGVPLDVTATYLRSMRKLIERGWTQNCRARTADGAPVLADHGTAAAWSLDGASVAVFRALGRAKHGNEAMVAADRMVVASIRRLYPGASGSTTRFNDWHQHTVAEVLGVIDHAIQACSPGPQ